MFDTSVTPLQVAAALAGQHGLVVLHSQRNDDDVGNRSFAACRPVATLTITGRQFELCSRVGVSQSGTADPFALIESFINQHCWQTTTTDAPAIPCVFGYLGYELGSQSEGVAPADQATPQVPDAVLAAYDAVAIWHHHSNSLPGCIVVGRDAASANQLSQLIASGLVGAADSIRLSRARQRLELHPDQPDHLHLARVERVLEFLRAGDVYQVNVTRRWTALRQSNDATDAVTILAALQAVAPSPFAGVFEFSGSAVISGSPELFLSRRGQELETRPIKGTRRRTGIPHVDQALAQELATAEKDGAEHLMIVDLERNDIGRVCEVGSVSVPKFGYTVELPHLLHKVSRVTGRLRTDATLADILQATFPGGSITGAPKVRAMQIIADLEPVRRGPYCGAIGWFGHDSFDLAMAIRVGVLTEDALTVHVGGGIVLDSNPQAELTETYDKIAGWRTALATISSDRRLDDDESKPG